MVFDNVVMEQKLDEFQKWIKRQPELPRNIGMLFNMNF
jgi:hypothetical protein